MFTEVSYFTDIYKEKIYLGHIYRDYFCEMFVVMY